MYWSRVRFIPDGEFLVPDFASDHVAEALSVWLSGDTDLDTLELVQHFLGEALTLIHLLHFLDKIYLLSIHSLMM